MIGLRIQGQGDLIEQLNTVTAKQFVKYSAVGLIGTSVHYLLLWILVEWGHLSSVEGTVCGFVAGAITNYFANYFLTFKSRKSHRVALPQFLSIAIAGLVVNTLVMAAGIHWLNLHYLVIQMFATGLVLIVTFLGNKYWTFSQTKEVN